MREYACHCAQGSPLNHGNIVKTTPHDLFNRLIVGRSADENRRQPARSQHPYDRRHAFRLHALMRTAAAGMAKDDGLVRPDTGCPKHVGSRSCKILRNGQTCFTREIVSLFR
jgi:hypothetical protein